MRGLIGASFFLMVMACMCTPLHADTAKTADHCAELHRLVMERQSFTEGKELRDEFYPVQEVFTRLRQCPSEAKIVEAFDTVQIFGDLKFAESGPRGQSRGDMTDEEMAQVQAERVAETKKAVDGYRDQLKQGSLDATTFKAVLYYLAWQSDDYGDIGSACELTARIYPDDFASVYSLTHGLGRDNCDDVAEEWMPKPASGAKH